MTVSRRTLLKGAASIAATGLAMPAVIAKPAPIRLGATSPFSGPQAVLGVTFHAGIECAVNIANNKGGILGRQIELIKRDDKGTGVGAVAAARELFDMDVRLLVGAFQSQTALAMAPILPDGNGVLIGTGTAMSLTHEDFNRHFFRGYANSNMNFGGLGRAVGQKFQDVSEWASIAFDTAFGHDSLVGLRNGLSAVQPKVPNFASPIFVAPTASDFKIEIANLMATNAEGLYIGMLGGPAITFLQQARSVGLLDKFKVIAEGGNDTAIGKAMQKNTPLNIWSRGYWYPEHPIFAGNPVSRELYDEYVRLTGKVYPDSMAQAGHKVALAMIKGIEKAGSPDTEAVISALEGLEFIAADGPTTIRKEDHQAFGRSQYGNIGPLDKEPFYAVREVIEIDDKDTIEPATPGVPFKLK
jgi:branched-chain amino acid transport system substrate-binding protein